MIELELKYNVGVFPNLLGRFNEQSESRILDIYYDNANYDLLHTGIFIRQRGKRIDIKYLISSDEHSVCNEYNVEHDLFHERNTALLDLLTKLNFKFSGTNFEAFLKENNLRVLLKIDKIRKKYKEDNVTVCFDEVQGLGKFIEIESTFPELKDIQTAKSALQGIVEQKIEFQGEYHEEHTGYVELYLKQHNPVAYERCLFKG